MFNTVILSVKAPVKSFYKIGSWRQLKTRARPPTMNVGGEWQTPLMIMASLGPQVAMYIIFEPMLTVLMLS